MCIRDRTLVVSFIGMASQEVSIKQNVSIILRSDTKVLGEVMVVAYGTAKKDVYKRQIIHTIQSGFCIIVICDGRITGNTI